MFCRQRKAMLAVFTILLTAGPYCAAAYDLVRDYSGSTFFDRWDFFGNWDNLTNGEVFACLSFDANLVLTRKFCAPKVMSGGFPKTTRSIKVWPI